MRLSSSLEVTNSRDCGHVVVHHAALDAPPAWARPGSRHFDVAEAVIGEARLPDFGAAALERVDVGAPRRAQVVEIERAVGLQRLGVAQRDARALRPGHLQAAPAHHVLAHVEDEDAGARLA